MQKLPISVQQAARAAFRKFDANPLHPGLHYKKVRAKNGEEYWSVRIDGGHRTLAYEKGGELFWFWIDTHKEYERIIL